MKTNQLQYLRVFNQSEQNIMGYIVMHNQSTLSSEEDWKLQNENFRATLKLLRGFAHPVFWWLETTGLTQSCCIQVSQERFLEKCKSAGNRLPIGIMGSFQGRGPQLQDFREIWENFTVRTRRHKFWWIYISNCLTY